MPKTALPEEITRYFWGDNLSDLNWENHQNYITQTLLERGSLTSLRWLFQHTSKNTLKQLLPTLKLSAKSANFWSIYLA